jgi:hypothetical protein
LIGTPDVVADAIEDYVRVSGTDGFILRTFVSPQTVEDFVTLILPRLRERGLYQDRTTATTLRSRIRGDGANGLPANHPGARHRWLSQAVR